MGAISTVSLVDQQAATHTLNPIQADVAQNVWSETDPSIPLLGQETLIIKHRKVSSDVPGKTTIRFNMPLVETIDGVDTVVGVHRFVGEYIVSQAGDYQSRRDFNVQVSDLVSDALVTTYVENQEPAY